MILQNQKMIAFIRKSPGKKPKEDPVNAQILSCESQKMSLVILKFASTAIALLLIFQSFPTNYFPEYLQMKVFL